MSTLNEKSSRNATTRTSGDNRMQRAVRKISATNLIRVRAKNKMNAVTPEVVTTTNTKNSYIPPKKPNLATFGVDIGVKENLIT